MSKSLIIIKQILATTDGRDKLFKVLQYSLKLSNWLKNSKSSLVLISNLSLARKMIRLLHGLDPLLELDTNLQDLTTINNVFSLMSDTADDVICLGKLKVLDQKWIDFATPISDRCWFITIILDIYDLLNSIRKEPTLLKKISLAKLGCDFIFCSIDVFKLDVSPGWQTVSGLLSGSIGTYKLIQKKL
jgi:hypothetical protein